MAHGVAGGRARVGVLLAPPYAPLSRRLTERKHAAANGRLQGFARAEVPR